MTLTDDERMGYAVSEPEDRYKVGATAPTKCRWSAGSWPGTAASRCWSSGSTWTSSRRWARSWTPRSSGETPNRERERLYDAFRRGEVSTLVVSKVANFSIDLPEATVAVQVSGTFGSRQEEAQRLGRVLRPKADRGTAHFYTVVARDTLDQDFAAHRQRFLAEQGYAYTIVDAADLLPPADSQSARVTAYSTSPCSVPGIGSSKCSRYVRVWVMPAFSAARRDRVLTAIGWPRLAAAPPAGALAEFPVR